MSHDHTQTLQNERPNREWEHAQKNREIKCFFFFKMMCVSVEANMNAKRLWEAIRILREMSDDILT